MNQYTSLDISRLIHSKAPEVETGTFINASKDGKEIVVSNAAKLPPQYLYDFVRVCPAYRLDDVLRAIEEHVPMSTYNDGEESEEWEYQCHRLLTAYLADGLQFGPRSEEVIRSIFT